MKHIRKGISKRGSMTEPTQLELRRLVRICGSTVRTEDYHETLRYRQKSTVRSSPRYLIKAIDQVCPGPLTTMAYLQKLAAVRDRYESQVILLMGR